MQVKLGFDATSDHASFISVLGVYAVLYPTDICQMDCSLQGWASELNKIEIEVRPLGNASFQ